MGRAVVDHPENPGGRGVGFGGHHLVHEVLEGGDPGLFGDRADDVRVVDVVNGGVGEGSAPAVCELDPPVRPGAAPRPGCCLRSAWSWDFSSPLIT